jgi:hypothetical protein
MVNMERKIFTADELDKEIFVPYDIPFSNGAPASPLQEST